MPCAALPCACWGWGAWGLQFVLRSITSALFCPPTTTPQELEANAHFSAFSQWFKVGSGQNARVGLMSTRPSWIQKCPSLSPAPAHCVQNSSIALPAGSRLTALVPSESAIRRLSPEDQAFWLQPKMLPELVRWGQLGRATQEGILGRTLGPSQTRLRESGSLLTASPQKWEGPR